MQFSIPEDICESLKIETRVDIAKNATYEEGLNLFLKDDYWMVREAVAQNPTTLPETLKELSKDKRRDVRIAVAQNPTTLQEIL